MELKKGNMPEMVDMSKIYITNRTSWQPLKALDVTGKRGVYFSTQFMPPLHFAVKKIYWILYGYMYFTLEIKIPH